MKILKTKFKGVLKIYSKKKKDIRGYFVRGFCKKELKKKSISFDIKQTNISFNKKKGTFRGFHFQEKPFSENKIINCFQGKILLIVLDIDPKSKNYLNHIKFNLSSNDSFSFYVSKNYATAFLTMKNDTLIFYYMSEYFKRNKGRVIRFDDPKLKIKLPFKPKIISQKDKNFKFLG